MSTVILGKQILSSIGWEGLLNEQFKTPITLQIYDRHPASSEHANLSQIRKNTTDLY